MKPIRLTIVILGLLVIVLAAIYLWPLNSPEPTPERVPEIQPIVPSEPESSIRHPLPESKNPALDEERLPDLTESDPSIEDLFDRFYKPSLQKLLIPQQFIRRMVLIIDTLPRQKIPMQHLPLQLPEGDFQTAGMAGAKIIAPENFDRYTPYVLLAEAVPAKRLAETYLRIYPLLESAYRELGHPQGYFHDRMIEVLDHLLATPKVNEPIPLVAHVNRYRFADPKLEALSAGQKVFLRMGRENAARVQEVLRNFRKHLVNERSQS